MIIRQRFEDTEAAQKISESWMINRREGTQKHCKGKFSHPMHLLVHSDIAKH